MIRKGFLVSRGFSLMLAILIMVGALLPGGVRAQDDDGPQVTWQQYDVTVQVNEDGTLRVTETVLMEFHDSFSKGERSIPMDRIEEISDVNVSVGTSLDDLAPSSETPIFLGDSKTFDVTHGGDDVVIAYGFDLTSSSRGYVRAAEISYTVHGAIRDYPEATPAEQQVRWTAISGEVTQTGPVESASVTIVFPEDIPEDQLAIDPEATTVQPDRVIWEAESLNEGDSLAVAVAFPPVTEAVAPAWQADADMYEGRQEHLPALNLILGMVALVTWVITIIFMIVRGVRDPEVGLVADIIPERPGDLAAPLVGTLVDEVVDTKDLLAGLLDLDRQGIITIREDAVSEKGKPKYEIVLNRPVSEAERWDRPMLRGLFGDEAVPGEVVDLSDQLKKLRAQSHSAISKAYDDELFARGYFLERPHTTRMRWLGVVALIFLISAVLVLGVALWARQLSGWVAVPGTITILGVIVGGILVSKAAVKTTEGAVEAAKWKAWDRYLKDLRKGPQPARFLEAVEQDLPWAVALGFDSSWSKLADDVSSSSTWDDRDHRRYRGTPVFGGYGMSDSSASSAGSGGGTSSGSLQGASARTLGAIGGGSAGIFSMLNDAAASFNAGASSGGSSSGGFSGSSSVGSSGGGGHSFS